MSKLTKTHTKNNGLVGRDVVKAESMPLEVYVEKRHADGTPYLEASVDLEMFDEGAIVAVYRLVSVHCKKVVPEQHLLEGYEA